MRCTQGFGSLSHRTHCTWLPAPCSTCHFFLHACGATCLPGASEAPAVACSYTALSILVLRSMQSCSMQSMLRVPPRRHRPLPLPPRCRPLGLPPPHQAPMPPQPARRQHAAAAAAVCFNALVCADCLTLPGDCVSDMQQQPPLHATEARAAEAHVGACYLGRTVCPALCNSVSPVRSSR